MKSSAKIGVLVTACLAGCGGGESVEPCVAQQPVLPALRIVPVAMTAASFATYAAQPKGSTDWYLVEQRGRIIILRDGQALPTPFLDAQAAFGSGLGERGLLSVAFHPSYASNGRFFTMGTPAGGADGSYAAADTDAVVEWKRDPANPDRALPTKVRDIAVMPRSAGNHNGGTALFGPDGMLYVGVGDGGGGCESDQGGSVQDVGKLFGKILRLDIDGEPPFAAAGNPFQSGDKRVYHYGLRNPFRFSFDRATRDLYIGDVGQDSFEEISLAPRNAAGTNFGWPAFEGAMANTCGAKPLAGTSPHTPPILSIDRRASSTSPFRDYSAIVGGRVYRGTAIPELRGVYLFADHGGSNLGALRTCEGQVYGPVAVPLDQIPTGGAGSLGSITSFQEGNDGEIYITYGNATRLGKLTKQ